MSKSLLLLPAFVYFPEANGDSHSLVDCNVHFNGKEKNEEENNYIEDWAPLLKCREWGSL